MSEKVKIELSGKELKSIADAFDLYFYDRVNSADQDYKFMSELDEKLLRLAKNGKDEK
ncbi:hypothetical protein FD12_GL001568 [Lentilactobacillus rapi DSM 19907 = JCM 15042]|uniref:Uncharacterized protein n=2 Tax=Lentilactobacillus rapi TaxID=481723 RepID=A0A512PLC4_9LACO|nr:hypothetical protein [Lentilactobacillus rapi]KRL17642.1 hypothetical protein FD12_GL001568 [Lentilactobacillus rapi DSM 19907 = JCM 15042]GEP72006.1 hypothetical protein LRA02_08740 [Lentilactobacillus rapi]